MEEQLAEYRKQQKDKFHKTKDDAGSADTKSRHNTGSPKKLGASKRKSLSDANDQNCVKSARRGLTECHNGYEGRKLQEIADSNSTNKDDPRRSDQTPKDQFSLISWNIDGLETKALTARTKYIINLVKNKNPAVIFFQEVVEASLALFKQHLSCEYDFFEPPTSERIPYFCIILVLRKQMTYCNGSFESHFFPDSMMGRHLLLLDLAPVAFPQEQIRLMTTHLESMKEHAKERSKQYICLLKRMTERRPSELQTGWTKHGDRGRCFVTSICGGDMNMRDKEVSDCGNPDNVDDVWTMLGSPGHSKFTWDTYKNTNKEMTGNFKPRCRFDRLYVYHDAERAADVDKALEGWKPISMKLVGTEKLDSCDMFASDHFGLDVVFKRKA
eukprot:GHVS01028877.1.p1 GENE.GHVS01028877.1~~GHVS01028877.1.p1  ORF type:complete len:385 (-),score=18.17 GHVS01028877.1:552-1706(-)